MWDSALSEHGWVHWQWAAVIAASLVAAVTDWRAGRIPNALTGPFLLGGLAWAFSVAGRAGVMDAVGGMFLMALPFVILFVFAGGGAGDAKLMGALGAWLGLGQGALALLAVLVAGGVYGVAVAAWRGELLNTFKRVGQSVKIMFFAFVLRSMPRIDTEGRRPAPPDQVNMPYAVPVCIGVCVAAARVWMTSP